MLEGPGTPRVPSTGPSVLAVTVVGMTSPRRPVKRPSKQVIHRRRRMGLVVVLVVVGLVAWLVVPKLLGGGGEDAAAEATASETPSPTPTSVTAADVAPTPGASSASSTPSATPTAAAVGPCAPPLVSVTAKLDATEYGPGAQPKMSLALENAGTTPCTIDVGTAKQSYTITSGSDTVWRSTDCQTDAKSQPVKLEPGQKLDAPPITWVRERSTKDTCNGERPAAVGGGATYQLQVQLDTLQSEPVRFVLL